MSYPRARGRVDRNTARFPGRPERRELGACSTPPPRACSIHRLSRTDPEAASTTG